jgi:hypothetical protein
MLLLGFRTRYYREHDKKIAIAWVLHCRKTSMDRERTTVSSYPAQLAAGGQDTVAEAVCCL